MNLQHAQTIAFTTIVLLELFRVYFVRSNSGVPLFSNLWLFFAVLVSFSLQLFVIYGPLQKVFDTFALGFNDWIIISITLVGVIFLSFVGISLKRKLD